MDSILVEKSPPLSGDIQISGAKNAALTIIIAAIPTVLYEVFNIHWITIPWLPVALVGLPPHRRGQ